VSYDLELAAQRAAQRLRGIARAESGERPTLAEWLEQIAASLEVPLAAVQRARQRDEERAERKARG
jgi:hypothetical protein